MISNKLIGEERAIELLKILEGAEITSAWRGYGSSIFIEFGKLAKRDDSKYMQGEQTLTMEWSWRLENSESVLVGSFDEDTKISEFPEMVIGESVESVKLFTRLKEIKVSLSGSLRLLSFSTTSGDPQWYLRYGDAKYLSVVKNKFEVEHAT